MDVRWLETAPNLRDGDDGLEFEVLGFLEKGWSADRKYVVRRRDGSHGLLRVSGIGMLERKKEEFGFLRRVHGSGVRCSVPYALGTCGEGCCMLLSYLEGAEGEAQMAHLPPEVQRQLGREAGEFLKRIHSLDPLKEPYDWKDRMMRKIEAKKRMFLERGIAFDGYGTLVRHIEAQLPHLEGRPVVLQHGDYHLGNMLVMEGPEGPVMGILDFNRFDHGDPYEDFTRMFLFSAPVSPQFSKGQVEGYFGGSVPEDFFRITSLYVALDTLSGLPWALDFGKEELNLALMRAETIMNMYNGFNRYVPSWYEDN